MLTPDYNYKAKITRIVDGDTVDAIVDLGFTVSVNVRFRLYGIDTMELTDKDPVKRNLAMEAKLRLISLVEGKEVMLKSYKTDKYGRWLAEIFLDGTSINKMLLSEGLAVEYK